MKKNMTFSDFHEIQFNICKTEKSGNRKQTSEREVNTIGLLFYL